VVARLSETAKRLSTSGSEDEAAIFEAHVELAGDPELALGVEERVRDLECPEAAVLAVGEEYAEVYTLAADRGNERLRRLQDADHPAVLELIRITCEAAREEGIWVGVCGEAAGDPALILRLLELGVTELSMSAPSIPRAKKLISEL
jgi:phosphoenolpyruvate-protein kinase (PTS system EI component)